MTKKKFCLYLVNDSYTHMYGYKLGYKSKGYVYNGKWFCVFLDYMEL